MHLHVSCPEVDHENMCFYTGRGQAHVQHVDFGEELFFEEKRKKGRFRGGVDECVDGGILMGVILS